MMVSASTGFNTCHLGGRVPDCSQVPCCSTCGAKVWHVAVCTLHLARCSLHIAVCKAPDCSGTLNASVPVGSESDLESSVHNVTATRLMIRLPQPVLPSHNVREPASSGQQPSHMRGTWPCSCCNLGPQHTTLFCQAVARGTGHADPSTPRIWSAFPAALGPGLWVVRHLDRKPHCGPREAPTLCLDLSQALQDQAQDTHPAVPRPRLCATSPRHPPCLARDCARPGPRNRAPPGSARC